MAKLVILLLLVSICCASAYSTNEDVNVVDQVQSEPIRVERAAIASADPDPGYKGHHYQPHYQPHYQHNYQHNSPKHHYPKHGGCHGCGHRG